MSKAIPKRKQWSAAQIRGPKRVKVEVKSTQTEETQHLTDGMTNEEYELMVKGILISYTNKLNVTNPPKLHNYSFDLELILVFVETPSSTYWKAVAEERRQALYNVLQENERVS